MHENSINALTEYPRFAQNGNSSGSGKWVSGRWCSRCSHPVSLQPQAEGVWTKSADRLSNARCTWRDTDGRRPNKCNVCLSNAHTQSTRSPCIALIGGGSSRVVLSSDRPTTFWQIESNYIAFMYGHSRSQKYKWEPYLLTSKFYSKIGQPRTNFSVKFGCQSNEL